MKRCIKVSQAHENHEGVGLLYFVRRDCAALAMMTCPWDDLEVVQDGTPGGAMPSAGNFVVDDTRDDAWHAQFVSTPQHRARELESHVANILVVRHQAEAHPAQRDDAIP